MKNRVNRDFGEFYKAFLGKGLTKGEKLYLPLIKSNSKAGKAYVKDQKEFLKTAYMIGRIHGFINRRMVASFVDPFLRMFK